MIRTDRWTAAASIVVLCACGPTTTTSATADQTQVTSAGPPRLVALSTGDHPEAYVTQVVMLRAQSGAKLYSAAGGDPMINGIHTYIAAFGDDAAEGWRVFEIGNFNSWRLIEDRGDNLVLEVSRSWQDDASQVRTATERYIVSVPGPTDTSVTITPVSMSRP